jgi:glyoxylase-like metal-dependent hydrolase (beta-lactamase superfamily II)
MRMAGRSTGLLWVLCVISSAAGWAGQEAPPPYDLVEVSASVVMAHHDNGSNLSCIALQDGLVFVDAGLSTRVAARFRHEMEARFERPATALVLTHAHLDHVLGMAAFDDLPAIAAAAGRPRWQHLTGIEWDERATAAYAAIFPTLPDELPEAELRMPDRWFDDELDLGGAVVRRVRGHTDDSSAIVVADGSVVIAGDLVQAARRPYFGEPDTDFSAWIGTLRTWEDLKPDAVCPGHGPVIDTTGLAAIRLWFERILAVAAELKADGATLEDMIAHDGLSGGYWPTEETVPRWWGFCVKRLYDAS